MSDNIERAIREFIVERFLFGIAEDLPPSDQSLLAARVLDSTGVLEMAAFLEERFEIEVKDEDMLPANFDSTARLASFVVRKREISTESARRSA